MKFSEISKKIESMFPEFSMDEVSPQTFSLRDSTPHIVMLPEYVEPVTKSSSHQAYNTANFFNVSISQKILDGMNFHESISTIEKIENSVRKKICKEFSRNIKFLGSKYTFPQNISEGVVGCNISFELDAFFDARDNK